MELSRALARPLAVIVFLAVLGFAVFRVPFHFPVAPSVSDFYRYQFNNRVAVLIFLAGAAAFAVLFRGLWLQPSKKDSRISPLAAFIAGTLCFLVCLLYWRLSLPYGLQGENIISMAVWLNSAQTNQSTDSLSSPTDHSCFTFPIGLASSSTSA
jgi:hypothetical protein